MVIFRADGNARIGAGHIMRCLTIAQALSDPNENGMFFCADEDSAGLAREHGFPASVLQSDYRNPEEELTVWEELLRDVTQPCRILVDSYYATDAYLAALRRYGQVFLMDDLGERPYPVDGVINYNAYADPDRYGELYRGAKVRLLLGCRYAPVRPRFQNCRYELRDPVRRILITAGGGDADNIAGAIYDRLREKESEGCPEYHIVMGRFNPHLDEMRRREAVDSRLQIHCDVKDMAGLMAQSDLCVTAGGTTVYELAAVGVPFLTFSCAENQEQLTTWLDVHGIAPCAGGFHRDRSGTLARIGELVARYTSDAELRAACAAGARTLTDGQGAERIAKFLETNDK